MIRFLLMLVFCLAPFTAQAETQTFTFDKKHTQILFFISHLGFSNSNGKFLDFDGSFTFDPENPSAGGEAEVIIQTASINMDDEAWDTHLKNEDFFNVEKYPAMTFKTTDVEITGDNTAKMTGGLTLLGVTKPVTLDVVLNKCGEHPRNGQTVCGFDARGTLNRSEWGMTNGIPMVSDEVDMRITVEASPAPEMNE